MIFTKVGLGVTWILFLISAVRLLVGMGLLFFGYEEAAVVKIKFGLSAVSIELEHSLEGLGVAIALGILVEISKTISDKRQTH